MTGARASGGRAAGSVFAATPAGLRAFVLSLFVTLLCMQTALAAPKIVVQGLFRDRAVVTIDGKQRLLRVGERSPEGVKLIRADSDEALLEVDGQSRSYRLGAHVAGSYEPPAATEVHIWPDGQGMYSAVGSINGMPVRFLVDTGATLIAMNETQARRLGLDFRLDGKRGFASTASGVVPTYKVTLDVVRVGDIRLRQVDALVIEGGFPGQVLLGMSFLSRLKIENHGAAMLLRQLH